MPDRTLHGTIEHASRETCDAHTQHIAVRRSGCLVLVQGTLKRKRYTWPYTGQHKCGQPRRMATAMLSKVHIVRK